MGRKVETTMEWMKDLSAVDIINIRRGGEHTIEYSTKSGDMHIVRIPYYLMDFITMCENALLKEHTVA